MKYGWERCCKRSHGAYKKRLFYGWDITKLVPCDVCVNMVMSLNLTGFGMKKLSSTKRELDVRDNEEEE